MVWHEVYAENAIGRGLDHPLIDRGKLESTKRKDGFDMARRWGEPIAWFRHLRDDTAIRNEGAAALAQPTTGYFRVAGPSRFVREHLPDADFAYHGWGFRADTGPGHEGRPVRSICCNARARSVLIESGVMKAARFEAIATVNASEAVSEILDRIVTAPLPLPRYTPEEHAIERVRRDRVLASRTPPAPRIRLESVNAAIDHLSRRLGEGSLPWPPALGTAEYEQIRASALHPQTPRAWQHLARFLPLELSRRDQTTGETFDFMMQPPEWNEWLAYEPGASPPDEQPSTDDLIIAITPYGDWYAFRNNDPLLPEDARIVRWDHETTLIGEEWPSVLAFVEYLLELGLHAQRE
jgi:hypothetical protein